MGITFKGLYELWSASHYERVSTIPLTVIRRPTSIVRTYNVPFVELKTADLQAVIDMCEKETD